MKTTISMALILGLIACGEINVDLPEDTKDKIDEAVDKVSDKLDDVLGEEDEETGESDVESEHRSKDNAGTVFLGTFKKDEYMSDCDNLAYENVRLYGKNGTILIRDSGDKDNEIEAEVFEDDTFDFSLRFINGAGQVEEMGCTCFIKESKWSDDKTMKCGCETDDELCDAEWNKL